jgi:hypothetical protein
MHTASLIDLKQTETYLLDFVGAMNLLYSAELQAEARS